MVPGSPWKVNYCLYVALTAPGKHRLQHSHHAPLQMSTVLIPSAIVGTVPTVVGGAVRGEPVCSTPKLLSNAYRQTQLSHSWGKIFLRRPCTSSSLPSEKAGWLSLSLLLYCQIAGGLAEVTGNNFFFFSFLRMSHWNTRQGCLEPSSWSFQDVDVSHHCQLSNLPPSCNIGRGYPS